MATTKQQIAQKTQYSTAADDPDPTLRHLVGRGGSDEQMDEGDEPHIGRVDAEEQPDGQDGLDRAGDIHPGGRRLEAGLDEELERRRHREFADDMGDEKTAQIMRRMLNSLNRLNLSASDMVAPPVTFFMATA